MCLLLGCGGLLQTGLYCTLCLFVGLVGELLLWSCDQETFELSDYAIEVTVRHEKRGIATPYLLLTAFLMPYCPVTVVQRYRDGVYSLLFHLFFIICHPYIPLHSDFIYSALLKTEQCYSKRQHNMRAQMFPDHRTRAITPQPGPQTGTMHSCNKPPQPSSKHY